MPCCCACRSHEAAGRLSEWAAADGDADVDGITIAGQYDHIRLLGADQGTGRHLYDLRITWGDGAAEGTQCERWLELPSIVGPFQWLGAIVADGKSSGLSGRACDPQSERCHDHQWPVGEGGTGRAGGRRALPLCLGCQAQREEPQAAQNHYAAHQRKEDAPAAINMRLVGKG